MKDLIKKLNKNTYRLYLPIFSSITPFKTAKPLFKDSLFIDLPKQFEQIWNNPIKDEKDLFTPLNELVHFLCPFIKEAQQKVAIQQKQEAFDLVTEMDQGIEYLLRFWIKKHFPDHKIIGEEFGQDQLSPQDYCWYIDPIDGTSNYANEKAYYCVNIACIYNGKPFLTIIGLPSEGRVLAANHVQKLPFKEPIAGLCSEFYSARVQDQHFFDAIAKQLQKKPFRTMALGYSLAKMYEGSCDVFYKSNVKLWDIMAPAALLYFHQQDYWDIEMMMYDGTIISPFSTQKDYLDYLNKRHAINQRVGLFTVTKKTDTNSKNIIRESIYG